MRAEDLQEVIHAAPFRAFAIVAADGQRIYVRHPEWILPPPGQRTAVVMDPDGRLHILDVMLLQRLEVNPPVPAGGPQPPFDIAALTRSLTWVILALTVIIQIAITLTIIFMLSTKSVRAAFAGQSSEPSDDEKERKPRSRYEGYDDDDQPPPPKSPGDTGITDRP